MTDWDGSLPPRPESNSRPQLFQEASTPLSCAFSTLYLNEKMSQKAMFPCILIISQFRNVGTWGSVGENECLHAPSVIYD